MKDWKITLLANEHCHTGENPLWDAERQCVYWTDIPHGKLFRWDWATQTHEQIYSGLPVGGFTLQAEGSLLLFRVNDIAVLPWRGEARSVIAVADESMDRFNDVTADPEGRVFAGTMGRTAGSGGLYRLDLDGTLTKLFAGTQIANGGGFSPDLSTFYWTDSTAEQLWRFNYERATGALTQRRMIYQAENEGTPDGLAIDAEGNLWSARWDGQAVIKHAPDGTVLGKIVLPVKTVASMCFGGPGLDTMLVTTANGSPGSTTEDGALFKIEGNFHGRADFHSRISW